MSEEEKKKCLSFISVECWKEDGENWKAIPAYNFATDAKKEDIKPILCIFHNMLIRHLEETMPYLLKSYGYELKEGKLEEIKND